MAKEVWHEIQYFADEWKTTSGRYDSVSTVLSNYAWHLKNEPDFRWRLIRVERHVREVSPEELRCLLTNGH